MYGYSTIRQTTFKDFFMGQKNVFLGHLIHIRGSLLLAILGEEITGDFTKEYGDVY